MRLRQLIVIDEARMRWRAEACPSATTHRHRAITTPGVSKEMTEIGKTEDGFPVVVDAAWPSTSEVRRCAGYMGAGLTQHSTYSHVCRIRRPETPYTQGKQSIQTV